MELYLKQPLNVMDATKKFANGFQKQPGNITQFAIDAQEPEMMLNLKEVPPWLVVAECLFANGFQKVPGNTTHCAIHAEKALFTNCIKS